MTIRSSMHLLSRDFMRAIDLKCTSDPISVPNCTRPVKLMIQRFVYISNDSKRKLIFVILNRNLNSLLMQFILSKNLQMIVV